jgi:ribosomal protein S27E
VPIDTARSIARLGFKRWYERQLIESHAWLVTCLLCGIAIAASLEMVNFRDPGATAMTLAFVFTAGLVTLHGFRRYQVLMSLAEQLASYAKFRAMDANPRMKVQCRKCGHQWTLD